jgi:hypothetical protein
VNQTETNTKKYVPYYETIKIKHNQQNNILFNLYLHHDNIVELDCADNYLKNGIICV